MIILPDLDERIEYIGITEKEEDFLDMNRWLQTWNLEKELLHEISNAEELYEMMSNYVQKVGFQLDFRPNIGDRFHLTTILLLARDTLFFQYIYEKGYIYDEMDMLIVKEIHINTNHLWIFFED